MVSCLSELLREERSEGERAGGREGESEIEILMESRLVRWRYNLLQVSSLHISLDYHR